MKHQTVNQMLRGSQCFSFVVIYFLICRIQPWWGDSSSILRNINQESLNCFNDSVLMRPEMFWRVTLVFLPSTSLGLLNCLFSVGVAWSGFLQADPSAHLTVRACSSAFSQKEFLHFKFQPENVLSELSVVKFLSKSRWHAVLIVEFLKDE